MKNKLDSRELATVLAALRYWQRQGLISGGQSSEYDIATDGDTLVPLDLEEIDELCERLNCGETRRYESCPKCGARVLRQNAFEDEGEGPEAGHTFYYCSERCRETH